MFWIILGEIGKMGDIFVYNQNFKTFKISVSFLLKLCLVRGINDWVKVTVLDFLGNPSNKYVSKSKHNLPLINN